MCCFFFFFPTLLPTWAVRRLGAETPHPWDLPGSISLPRSCERGEAELIVLLALFPALRHQQSILQQKKKKIERDVAELGRREGAILQRIPTQTQQGVGMGRSSFNINANTGSGALIMG